MLNFFKKNKAKSNPISIDIHSHLIPGVDDGVKSMEEALGIIKSFESMGYSKIITTPHIMKEYYDNDKSTLHPGFEELQARIISENIDIKLEYAAEYQMDEFFIEKVDKDEELLTFGDGYVLVETSFYNAPVFLKDVFFTLKTKGYSPIYAHPERYLYLMQNFQLARDLKNMQVLFQINAVSLTGHYGKPVKKLAEKLIEEEMVDFIGSDCHNAGHMEILQKAIQTNSYQNLPFDRLLNNSL